MAHECYYDIRIPNTGDEFERLTQVVCEYKYGIPFERYGRTGQKQYGIDLFSKGFQICVQCKNYQGYNAAKRLCGEIECDFNAAVNKFKDCMQTYILATTVQRDTSVQNIFARLSKAHPEIDIQVLFWENFQDALQQEPDLILNAQYPSDAAYKLQSLIDALYEALCHFRRAVNENSNTGTDAALSEISTVIQKLYDLGERYEKTQPEIKNKCTSFVNIYNSFVDAYTKFAMANRSELQTQIYSAAVNSNFQELLKLSLDDNYTSTNIVKQKIHTSLESLYNKLCDFRYSVNASNTHSINSSLEGVADAIQQVFSIAERYSISHPDICVKCTEIVDQYNSFITAYRAFLIEYQQGNNARTEYLNTTVNMHYRKLIDDILDALH